MTPLSFQEFCDSLHAIGIGRGDIVHVQSDLRRIGPVETEGPMTRESLCDFYIRAFREVLGPEGTLTMLTAFEDYGRYGAPFHRESSPSRSGLLSEYFLTIPGVERSMHPIMSITGLGAGATDICGGAHYEGLGWVSPWGELHRANAKLLTLGMDADGGGTTFFHYVEHLYGQPYVYVKLYTYPVYADGEEIPGPFTCSVRYLDFDIAYTPVRVKHRLLDLGLAKQAKTGRATSWMCPAADAVDTLSALFSEDRWTMMQEPPKFRPGVAPMDGVTGEERDSYNAER